MENDHQQSHVHIIDLNGDSIIHLKSTYGHIELFVWFSYIFDEVDLIPRSSILLLTGPSLPALLQELHSSRISTKILSQSSFIMPEEMMTALTYCPPSERRTRPLEQVCQRGSLPHDH